MIEFRDIHKSFGKQSVLRGLNLHVQKGEVLYIIGTSGVGKSVAIKHLIGIIRPDRGEILFEGEPIQRLSEKQYYRIRRRCAMVFQHSTLFDSLSILDNVALPLRKHRHLAIDEARTLARSQLELVRMNTFAEKYPPELSDGMRKRVAIARALTLEPDYVLFDEPTTGLDPISARRVDQLIRSLKELGVTSIVVSHDLASIFSVADRIAFIYRGVAYKVGTIDEFKHSTDPVVRQFIEGRREGPMETPGF